MQYPGVGKVNGKRKKKQQLVKNANYKKNYMTSIPVTNRGIWSPNPDTFMYFRLYSRTLIEVHRILKYDNSFT